MTTTHVNRACFEVSFYFCYKFVSLISLVSVKFQSNTFHMSFFKILLALVPLLLPLFSSKK